MNLLRLYEERIGERLEPLDRTLDALDATALRTWNVGHEIRNAIRPVYSSLCQVSIFFAPQTVFVANESERNHPANEGKVVFTPGGRDRHVAAIRDRVIKACKEFPERQLLLNLRRAIAVEKSIAIEHGPAFDMLTRAMSPPLLPELVAPGIPETTKPEGPRLPNLTPEQKKALAFIKKSKKDGVTGAQIATHVGRTEDTVRRWCSKSGRLYAHGVRNLRNNEGYVWRRL